MKTRQRIKILVVGANVAGLSTCKELARLGFKVTVVDPNSRFEWLPNIHEIVSGSKPGKVLQFNKKRLLVKLGHTYIQAEVVNLDAEAGFALLSNGERISFDRVVVATGGVNQSFGVPGVDDYAYVFKSVKNAESIRSRLEKVAEEASQGSPARVVIVGGGIEGVEVLGELQERYGHRDDFLIDLVNSSSRILDQYSEEIHRRVTSKAASNVSFHHEAKVAEVKASGVILDNGSELKSDITIWTGGVTASGKLFEWGLAKKRHEWAPANLYLKHETLKNVYLAGDCADIAGLNSKQAYHALDMGKHVARNLVLEASGRSPRRFKASSKPVLITFGESDCFMVSDDFSVASPSLLPLKEAIYQLGINQIQSLNGLRDLRDSSLRLKRVFEDKRWLKMLRLSMRSLPDTAISRT